MEKIIGYSTKTAFLFNCYVTNADGKRICDFQISGDGDKNEMIRLHNTLLDNGFHISSCKHEDYTIPIIDRQKRKDEAQWHLKHSAKP